MNDIKKNHDFDLLWGFFIAVLIFIVGYVLHYATHKEWESIKDIKDSKMLIECSDQSRQWFSLPTCGEEEQGK